MEICLFDMLRSLSGDRAATSTSTSSSARWRCCRGCPATGGRPAGSATSVLSDGVPGTQGRGLRAGHRAALAERAGRAQPGPGTGESPAWAGDRGPLLSVLGPVSLSAGIFTS